MSRATLSTWLAMSCLAVCGVSLLARQSLPASSTPSAETLLNVAVRTAAAERKAVMVVFGASWCGPCVQLDGFLNAPDTKKVLASYFVLQHLTVWERQDKIQLNNPGSEELLRKWSGEASVPFIAVLDSSGRNIATWDDGLPDKADRQKFLALLTRSAPALTGPERAMLLVELRHGLAAISGKVTDEHDHAVVGAKLSVVSGTYNSSGQWTPIWGPHAETDDSGRYSIEDVTAGEYRLFATSSTGAATTPISLTAREDRPGVDVRLTAPPMARISGVAIGTNGEPIAQAAVALVNIDQPSVAYHVITRTDGRFSLPAVQAGRYNAWVKVADVPPSAAPTAAGFEPLLVTGAAIDGLKLAAKKGGVLSGTVTFEGGSPSAASIAAIRVVAVAVDPEPGAPDDNPQATLSPAARFTLRRLFGTRTIRLANVPAGWALDAVWLNGEDVTQKPFDLTGLAPIEDVRIVVARTATVR
jgi:hypothetical protein